jgi:hypothetical protein
MEKKVSVNIIRGSGKTSRTYFLEKTSNLLYDLLVGKGDAKSRLRENELNIMYILHLDIPSKLKPKQKEIIAKLSKKETLQVDKYIIASSFQHTLSGMRNSTAAEIIKKISSLYHEVKYFDE